MPIYEYVCEACGRLTETMQKVADPPPASCPECGGGPLARLVSRTTFQLKGGGWYSDLYASPKSKKASPAEAGSASGSGGETSSAGASPPKDGGSSGGSAR
ncbi:MAG TPA: zinc ribbon domain-containing protein [Anaeromyxobacteraceae bacterium]|nr:zinc ribbon domain-containing protein [Anaeromyxobacteraceae bacterium]